MTHILLLFGSILSLVTSRPFVEPVYPTFDFDREKASDWPKCTPEIIREEAWVINEEADAELDPDDPNAPAPEGSFQTVEREVPRYHLLNNINTSYKRSFKCKTLGEAELTEEQSAALIDECGFLSYLEDGYCYDCGEGMFVNRFNETHSACYDCPYGC